MLCNFFSQAESRVLNTTTVIMILYKLFAGAGNRNRVFNDWIIEGRKEGRSDSSYYLIQPKIYILSIYF